MTRPDAATEALAEIVSLIMQAVLANGHPLDRRGAALMLREMLRSRGYVIRKARKSG